ncbi:MAG: hypothetical protein MUP21_01310 [Dehalococcoidia bacterium]|nr:hypothetical protein [Dehalococcoidia bacterium]
MKRQLKQITIEKEMAGLALKIAKRWATVARSKRAVMPMTLPENIGDKELDALSEFLLRLGVEAEFNQILVKGRPAKQRNVLLIGRAE